MDSVVASEGTAQDIEGIPTWIDQTKSTKRILTDDGFMLSNQGKNMRAEDIVLGGVFALRVAKET